MSLRLLVLSDHHLPTSRTDLPRGYAPHWGVERVLDAIAHADLHGADALLSTGDLVDTGDAASYAFACEIFGVTPAGRAPGPLPSRRPGFDGLPIYFVPGNHDARDAWASCLFPDTPVADRYHLTFEVAGTPFTFLDTGLDGRRGALTGAALDHLRRDLTNTSPRIVVLHHHPVPVGIPWLDDALPHGLDRFHALVSGGNVAAVLFGHVHAHVDATVGGVPALGTRATGIQLAGDAVPELVLRPPGYRVIDVHGGTVTTQRYQVPFFGPAIAEAIA